MKLVTVDLAELRQKFKVTSDNVFVFDHLNKGLGSVLTINPGKYTETLNEFNIFYTIR